MGGVYGAGIYGDGIYGGTGGAVAHGMKLSPLAVVLETVDGRESITREVSNLVTKNSSPGGFASVEFDLVRRLDRSRLSPKARVFVYDTATGEQVGGGRIIEQGMSDDGTWKVACLGEGLAALQDIDEPYMVVDADLKPWARVEQIGVKTKMIGRKQRKNRSGTSGSVSMPRRKIVTSIVSAEAKLGSAPDGSETEGLLFQVPEGTTVAPAATLRAMILTPFLCGQRLGAYGYRVRAGKNAATWETHGVSMTGHSASETDRVTPFVTGNSGMDWQVHTTNFAASRDGVQLRIVTSAAATTDARTWAHVTDLIVRTQLLDRNGNVRPGSDHASSTVGASSVFTDLIKRRCPTLEIGNIANSTRAFSQLAWYDGVTAKEVLDELCEADGTVTYHAWEANADGKTVINLDPVSPTVRYELSTKHGYSAPSPTSEVYDRVVVTYTDSSGYVDRLVVDRSTDGNPRSQTINLTAVPSGETLATIANQFLDAFAAPPNSGTITVAERVQDLWTGRWVHPAAIRSGYLCRVRGVQPTPDTLNPEAKQDGVTIFRIATSTYADGVATLELDQPVLNQDRALAALLS